MQKNKKNRQGVIYSTNADFEYQYENKKVKALTNNDQLLEVCIDKHRAGKIAVIIKNFIGTSEDLKTLARMLKTKCGVGGSIKKGDIIIQGDIRSKVIKLLSEAGYNYKRVGG